MLRTIQWSAAAPRREASVGIFALLRDEVVRDA